LWIAIAVIVALSRVVVRIHHLSDILGGIVTGALLSIPAVIVTTSLFA
jgi:membrane-associated phospholipid phosphatase